MNKQMMNELNKLSQTEKLNLAKDMLTDLGFFTSNLWHIDDVKCLFECDDDSAMDVLKKALENDATMEQIWLAIRIAGESLGLQEKNND